jgi:hypothetical protein
MIFNIILRNNVKSHAREEQVEYVSERAAV